MLVRQAENHIVTRPAGPLRYLAYFREAHLQRYVSNHSLVLTRRKTYRQRKYVLVEALDSGI